MDNRWIIDGIQQRVLSTVGLLIVFQSLTTLPERFCHLTCLQDDGTSRHTVCCRMCSCEMFLLSSALLLYAIALLCYWTPVTAATQFEWKVKPAAAEHCLQKNQQRQNFAHVFGYLCCRLCPCELLLLRNCCHVERCCRTTMAAGTACGVCVPLSLCCSIRMCSNALFSKPLAG